MDRIGVRGDPEEILHTNEPTQAASLRPNQDAALDARCNPSIPEILPEAARLCLRCQGLRLRRALDPTPSRVGDGVRVGKVVMQQGLTKPGSYVHPKRGGGGGGRGSGVSGCYEVLHSVRDFQITGLCRENGWRSSHSKALNVVDTRVLSDDHP